MNQFKYVVIEVVLTNVSTKAIKQGLLSKKP